MVEKAFTGPFAARFQALLDEKRAQGYIYKEQSRLLHMLDKMSLDYDCKDGLPKQLVLDFVRKQPHWSQGTQESRVFAARLAAVYLSVHGIHAYVCDSTAVTRKDAAFKAHIFTCAEISAIFSAADNIKPNRSNSHYLYPVLLRMLYGCGLRISEALKLRMKDVDIEEGVLKIKDAKNHRDRLVPMHDSLVEYCRRYCKQIHMTYQDDDYFFQSRRGQYHDGTVYHYFRELLFRCGISHGGRGSGGPRLHDLRHTFCVRSLRQMLENGLSSETALQLLSTYVGHSDMSATGRYLQMTADIYPEVVSRFESLFADVLPGMEVSLDEEAH